MVSLARCRGMLRMTPVPGSGKVEFSHAVPRLLLRDSWIRRSFQGEKARSDSTPVLCQPSAPVFCRFLSYLFEGLFFLQ